MRRKQTQSISEVLKEFSKNSKFDDKLLETRLVSNWNTLLGPTVANGTRSVHISNRTLFVAIESAVMRHELFMLRNQIKDALNKSVGASIIDSIMFR
jgi:predicted nucleic acid-binding Zn ribbon protein